MSLNLLNSPPTPLRPSADSWMPTTCCLLSDMLLAVNLPLLTTIFDTLCFFLALLSSGVGSAFLGYESTMAK